MTQVDTDTRPRAGRFPFGVCGCKLFVQGENMMTVQASAPKPIDRKIEIQRDKTADFCRRHYIRKLSLFGSVLREDFRSDSDVDVLVEFEPATRLV